MFPFGDPIDYEPPVELSLAGMAAAERTSPVRVLLDRMAADPTTLFMAHINNYADGDAGAIYDMLTHPASVVGLGDGGAHVATICDASVPTTMLTHWARDRRRGPRIPLELVVKAQTADTARLYGLDDRGTVAPGRRADLNVIDFDRLTVRRPELTFDLPAGARRLVQRADGYRATIKDGVLTVTDDELTGRVVRGRTPPG
jgi:N-acyl-D-aspartate/D-glutamate deacylase